MKKITIITGIVLLSIATFAQTPPHPNGGGAPGSGNTPVGGGAPIGGGLLILLGLGLGYSARKVYNFKEHDNNMEIDN